MGCSNSKEKDVGFDWWKLVKPKEWESLQSLVDKRPETCLQRDSSGDLLLHGLCKEENIPTYVLADILSAHAECASMPNEAGLLPLHVACHRQGDTKNTAEIIKMLIETHPGACNVGSVLQNNLPLHELLQRR